MLDNDETNIPRTIFHTVLESNLSASEKQVPRVTDEAFVMVVAGGETTARAISNTLFHLLSNPGWKGRVVAEIDQVMPEPATLPHVSVLEQLPLLTAVIKECLRVTTLVSNRVQLLDPAGELSYRQWTIPRGTPVSMSVASIHHDLSIFRDPNVFDPNRFLGEEAKIANKYYYPFLTGSRACLGMK
jgi:cytochrome P450